MKQSIPDWVIQFFCMALIVVLGIAEVGCNTPSRYTIGVINLSPQLEPILDGFKSGMSVYGYTDEAITYIYSGPAPDIAGLDKLAQELVSAEVDLILAMSTPATQAAHRATLGTTIPVLFAPVTDPVAAGVVSSLSLPGGLVTGVALSVDGEQQRLQWLLRLVPNVRKIYLPYNEDDASALVSVNAVIAAAEVLNVELVLRPVRTQAEIEAAIAEIPDDVQAIFLAQDSLVAAQIKPLAAAAIAHQLPLCTPTDGQVAEGALVSYGFRLLEIGQQTARLADQLFQGISPAELPVETAEFFLTINLSTADAIHLTIPDDMLHLADMIIR